MKFKTGDLLTLTNLSGRFIVLGTETSAGGRQIIEARQFRDGILDSYVCRFASDTINVDAVDGDDIEANFREVGLID